MMPKLLLALVCVWGLGARPGAAANYPAGFTQGLELSRAGDFAGAAQALAGAAQVRPAVGTLLNLGRAEWNRGRAGPAILAWEQARWLRPQDTRVLADLAFARRMVEVEPPRWNGFEAASLWLPPSVWFWLAAAVLWLALGALVLPTVRRSARRGWHQSLAAAGAGLFLLCLAANYGVVSRANLGFVLQPSAPLLLTPTQGGEVLGTLNPGEPARRLRTQGGYDYIRTADTAGWIARGQFGLVCPEAAK